MSSRVANATDAVAVGSEPIRVVGAALIRNGHCLVARRSATMAEPLRWEFPGGKLEPGETAEQSLVRELREELGVESAVLDSIGENEGVFGNRRLRLTVHAAELLLGEPRALEHAALAWLGPDELLSLDWAPLDVPLVPLVIARLRATQGTER